MMPAMCPLLFFLGTNEYQMAVPLATIYLQG